MREQWHFTAPGPTSPGQPASSIDASPTVVGGLVYIGSRTGMFYALHAATGAVVWSKQLDWGSDAVCPARGIIGTAAVQPDPADGVLTAYVPGAHYLYALDAVTGAMRWKRAIGPAASVDYYNWSSPTVARGRIFMGLAASCESKLIRGGVVSLDQHSGAVLHTWYAVPAGKVGASMWTSVASDGRSVWASTGNPDPNGTTIDDSYSIVRLAASSLTKLDTWTVPNTQAADYDFGSSPTLFAGTPGGVPTPMVTACNKNGVLYGWQSHNLAAGPVWSHQVGLPGAWATGSCLPGPAWDYRAHRLFAASNTTTVNGVTAPGAIRALDPTTGQTIWERSLPCLPVGSPTVNGTVVAVPMYALCTTGLPAVQLFSTRSTAPRSGPCRRPVRPLPNRSSPRASCSSPPRTGPSPRTAPDRSGSRQRPERSGPASRSVTTGRLPRLRRNDPRPGLAVAARSDWPHCARPWLSGCSRPPWRRSPRSGRSRPRCRRRSPRTTLRPTARAAG